MWNTSNMSRSIPENVEVTRRNLPWIVLFVLLSVQIIVGNVLILVSLSRFRDSRSSIHILIGNLAVSDLIVGAILLPYCAVVDILEFNSNKYVCLTKASLMVFAIGGATYGLLLVSVDRFSAVCFPFKHYRILRGKNIVILIVIGWTYVAIISCFPLSGWNYYDVNTPRTCAEYEVLTPNYQKFMNCNFIVGLSVNLTLYLIVMRVAIKKAREIHTAQTCVYFYRRNTRELYKVKTMAMIQGLFALCWLPYVVLAVTLMFKDDFIIHEMQSWSLVPGLLNSALNWLIYGYRNKEVRKQMKRYMKCSFKNRSY